MVGVKILDALAAAPMPSRRQFRQWATQEPILGGLRPEELPGVLLDTTRPVDYERRDGLLAALIRLSRTDEQAHQLLIVCLLPGLRRKITEHGFGLRREEATAIALAALCRRIANYPLLRRPRKIAINLLMDTGHDLIDAREKEQTWRKHAYLSERDRDGIVEEPGEPPEMIWEAARRAGVLNDHEIALIRAAKVHDVRIDEVAPLVGSSTAAARKALQRALYKLRAWLDSGEQVA